ncbi:MAG: hypothetical protein V7647_3530 [Acidobacteriota bacterium]
MTDEKPPQQALWCDSRGRRLQGRHLAATQKREAEKAAWFNRDPEVVAADLRRLHELLFDRARWKFAATMSSNPHSYSLRRTWERDEDFVWTVGTIRCIGVREKYPPSGPAARWYVVYRVKCPRSGADCQFWTMNWPIGDLSWGWARLNTAGTTLINRKPPFLESDRR